MNFIRVLALCFGCVLILNPAGAQTSLSAQRLAFEHERLAAEKERDAAAAQLERDKLALERDRFAFSRQQGSQMNWTAVSVGISAMIGLGGLLFSFYNLRKQAELQFQIKAAEIAMSDARSETVAFHRAKWLKVVFSGLLPANFGEDFSKNRSEKEKKAYSFGNSVERRIELMKLVAEKTSDIHTIIDTWHKLNPEDNWFEHFDVTPLPEVSVK